MGIPDLLDTYMKHCTDKTIGPYGGELYPTYDQAWNPPGTCAPINNLPITVTLLIYMYMYVFLFLFYFCTFLFFLSYKAQL